MLLPVIAISLLAFSSTSNASSEFSIDPQKMPWKTLKSPIIVMITGLDAHQGNKSEPSTCKIYLKDIDKISSSAPAKLSKYKSLTTSSFLALLRASHKAKDINAMHFKAAIPSTHIFGYIPTNNSNHQRAFLLEHDYQTLVFKDGKESNTLRSFAKEYCKMLFLKEKK